MIAPTPRTPIDLGYMAAVLEHKGVPCIIRDYPAEGRSWQAFRADLRLFRPDCLIASTTTPTLHKDLNAFEIAKEEDPKVLTLAKGAHFIAESVSTLQRCPQLDVTIRGECEPAVGEIAEGNSLADILGLTYRSNGSIARTPDRPFLASLDDLPEPARRRIRNEIYLRPDTGEMQTTVLASRGCTYRCVFCLAGDVHGQTLRLRSTAGIAGELNRCRTAFGIRNFYLQADTFTLNRDWVLEL
jgi:radical SAM superfamily enzyme YgiQ (UPF0313 family)